MEQELIAEGLPQEEVIKLCDVHSQALKGVIAADTSRDVPPGHPVHTFILENRALQLEIGRIEQLVKLIGNQKAGDLIPQLKTHCNNLFDVEKEIVKKIV